MRPFHRWEKILFLITISAVTLLIVLDYSVANVAIPYIAGDLSVNIDQGLYVITSFSVGNSIGLALTGWLSQRFGQVRLLMLSTILFLLFSWICGWSSSLLILVAARFFQGLVSGPMTPLSQSIIILHSTPQGRSKDLSAWSMMVIMGPVIGPLVGGYISYWYSWPWIFYINIPIGLVCVIVLWWLLRNRETPVKRVPGDPWGIFFLCIAVACFQIFLDKGQQWDWWNSLRIRAAFLICIVAAVFLVIQELKTKYPVLPLRLFRFFSYAAANVMVMLIYGIYFGSIVIIPRWLQEFMNYNAIWAGIAVCPLGIGPLLVASFIPMLMRKFGKIPMLAMSFCLFGLSALYTSFFITGVDVQHIAFSRFLMGFGFVCYLVPLTQLAQQEVPSAEIPDAVAMYYFFRALSSALGASLFSTLWQRRTIFHHERIGSELAKSQLFSLPANDLPSLASLNEEMNVQAAMLAMNDVFYLVAWLFGGLLVCVLGLYFLGFLKDQALSAQQTQAYENASPHRE